MLRAIAKDLKITLDDVLLMDYNTAFVVSQMLQEERRFRIRYADVIKENQKRNQK